MNSEQRCRWAGPTPLMQHYHDTEWGVPEHDARMMWETLMLEGFQAGLSWEIILHKREGFREAFADFDPRKVAAFDADDIERLMANPGIVRARVKIKATIRGAQIFLEMREKGEHCAEYCCAFISGGPIAGETSTTQTDLSVAIEGAEGARLQVRRNNDRLCLDAGSRPHQ